MRIITSKVFSKNEMIQKKKKKIKKLKLQISSPKKRKKNTNWY